MQNKNAAGGRLIGAAVLALGLAAGAQAADVGVSVSISQPGVYGRIDIGRFPQPTVIVSQPVVVYRQPVAVQPVYMWVPPGHRKHWRQHCAAYNACGVPVYFVREDWYQQRVMPQRGHGEREWRRDERRDDRHDDGRHRGEGEGRGHGKGRHD